MSRENILLGVILVLLVGILAWGFFTFRPQSMMSTQSNLTIPNVKGFVKSQEVLFIHTEASDKDVSELLTNMMNSPVVHVPAIGKVPEDALAKVYVFTNGVSGGGPMGFQPDVFDWVPGDAGYSPLRRLNLVTWKEEVTARELHSVEEIMGAEDSGELSIEEKEVVINMPFVKWQGGQR